MKLNPLPPHLRENQRYIVFEIISNKTFAKKEVINEIWKRIIRMYGDVASSRFNLWIPYNLYNEEKKIGIIKTNNLSVEYVRMAIATITEINGNKVIFKVHGVSGTIKSAKNKYLQKTTTLLEYGDIA